MKSGLNHLAVVASMLVIATAEALGLCFVENLPDSVERSPHSGHTYIYAYAKNRFLRVRCKREYKETSDVQIKCAILNGNPKWENVPNCTLITCPLPTNPVGGAVRIYGRGLLDSTAHYTCTGGSQYIGTNPRVCKQEGRFSGRKGRCVRSCDHIRLPLPERVVVERDAHQVRFSCDNEDFAYDGETLSCEEETRRMHSVGRCVRKKDVRCTSPDIKHSLGQGMQGYGEFYKPRCEKGFSYTGPPLRCAANGSFVGERGTCKTVVCQPPDTIDLPDNVTIHNITGHKWRDTILLKANEGYDCEGLEEIACQANGTWSVPNVECHPAAKTAARSASGAGHCTAKIVFLTLLLLIT